MRVLLKNTTFLLHKVIRTAGIIRVAVIIRGPVYMGGNKVIGNVCLFVCFKGRIELLPYESNSYLQSSQRYK